MSRKHSDPPTQLHVHMTTHDGSPEWSTPFRKFLCGKETTASDTEVMMMKAAWNKWWLNEYVIQHIKDCSVVSVDGHVPNGKWTSEDANAIIQYLATEAGPKSDMPKWMKKTHHHIVRYVRKTLLTYAARKEMDVKAF